MTPKIFDTHAHLNDESLKENLLEVIDRAIGAGVEYMMAVGIDTASSREVIEIAEAHPTVFASVGIHPNSCHLFGKQDWSKISEFLRHPKVKAIGETGIDCYWNECPLEIQKEWFERHIRSSHESALPIIVHLRDSENEILEVFEATHDSGQINGIMHSFTGSIEAAETCLDYGMYISFAGMVTFKNANEIRNVAKQIPIDRILVETDSPYLTPHPHRGKKPNEPKMVVHTATCLAKLHEISLEDLAAQTTRNAKKVFGIEDTN